MDRIRAHQQQRLTLSVHNLEQARDQLRIAIALVETRETEHQAVTADVQAKLTALELVLNLANDAAPHEALAEAPQLTPTKRSGGLISNSSRPLLSTRERTTLSALSILQ